MCEGVCIYTCSVQNEEFIECFKRDVEPAALGDKAASNVLLAWPPPPPSCPVPPLPLPVTCRLPLGSFFSGGFSSSSAALLQQRGGWGHLLTFGFFLFNRLPTTDVFLHSRPRLSGGAGGPVRRHLKASSRRDVEGAGGVVRREAQVCLKKYFF